MAKAKSSKKGAAFADRVKRALKHAGIDKQELRNHLGLSPPGMDGWLDGSVTAPRSDLLLQAADLMKVNARWLVFGEEPMQASVPEDYQLVPRYEVSAGMGQGERIHSEQVVDHLAFRRDWLRAQGVPPEHAMCVTARGESMNRVIRDGSVCLVDRSKRRGNGVFAITIPGDGDDTQVVIKRLEFRVDGELHVLSDSKEVREEPVIYKVSTDLSRLHIIGRVVWAGSPIV